VASTSSTWKAIGWLLGLELAADRGGVDDLESEVAGLELAAGNFAVVDRVLQAECLAVELDGSWVVGDEDDGEVDAADRTGLAHRFLLAVKWMTECPGLPVMQVVCSLSTSR